MALQGNLRDFSATEILQLLGAQKKTGCLTLEWNTERGLVYVQEGRIVSTRRPGMTKDDPLLGFLRGIHRLSDEQYHGILTIQRESNRDLEDLLLNGRYLDAEELAAYIDRQILDDLMRLTRWESGSYRFDPNNRWTNPPLVQLNIEGALIEAARRVDEQKRYVSVFKDPHQLLGVRDLPNPEEPLSEEERELFGIIDGRHSVAEVVEAAPLSEYEAYEALHRMLEANWLEIVGRRDPGRPEEATRSSLRPDTRHASIVRELAVAASVILLLMGLRAGSRTLRPAPRALQDDVFAAAQVRDVRLALDLYQREHGVYPTRLGDLVEDRWVRPDQTRLPGYQMNYHVERGGQNYRLDVDIER